MCYAHVRVNMVCDESTVCTVRMLFLYCSHIYHSRIHSQMGGVCAGHRGHPHGDRGGAQRARGAIYMHTILSYYTHRYLAKLLFKRKQKREEKIGS